MLDQLSFSEKKAVLFATRLRFGPEVKVPRDKAVDRIIEKALYVASADQPFTVEQIVEVFREICRVPAIRGGIIRSSLARLLRSGRVVSENRRYSLSPEALKQVDTELGNAERSLDDVIRRLFRGISFELSERILRQFFLAAMAEVFSLFGDSWVKSLVGADSFAKLLRPRDVELLVEKACQTVGVSDQHKEFLFARVIEFLQDTSDPLYSAVKFNFGQSFYVAKLLGYDTPVDVLSADLYNGATFYLDSNVVLTVLLGVSRHTQSIQELARVCKRLNARLAITDETLAEAARRVASAEAIAGRVYDRVPEALIHKTSDDFFESYRLEKAKSPSLTVDEFFAPLRTLRQIVRDRLGVDSVDLPAEALEKDRRLEAVKNRLQEASVRTRGRLKRSTPLRHDALHYLWIDKAREESHKTWFVSLDRSLPAASKAIAPDAPPFALGLDALLQSLSTFLTVDEDCVAGDGFSEIFSRLIAAQIMPLYPVFEVADFAIFEDLGMDCRDLPIEDVDAALSHVKGAILQGGAYLDGPREEAMYAMRAYFAAPDKRVRSQLACKDAELEELRARFSDVESAGRELSERLAAEERRALLAEENIAALGRQSSAEQARRLEKKKGAIHVVLIEVILLTCAVLLDGLLLKFSWGRAGLYPGVIAVGLLVAKACLAPQVWNDVKGETTEWLRLLKGLVR